MTGTDKNFGCLDVVQISRDRDYDRDRDYNYYRDYDYDRDCDRVCDRDRAQPDIICPGYSDGALSDGNLTSENCATIRRAGTSVSCLNKH